MTNTSRSTTRQRWLRLIHQIPATPDYLRVNATCIVFVVALALVLFVKTLPEPALILGAGVIGILLHGAG